MDRRILAALIALVLVAGCTSGAAGTPITNVGPLSSVETPAPADTGTTTSDQLQRPALPSSYAALTSRTWALLAKAPDKYVGKGYKLWACITQFDAATGASAFRGLASYRAETDWFAGANTFFAGDESALTDFVQGDIVSMSAVSMGSYSYDTQAGGNTTAPLFWVVKIKRASGSC